MITRLEIRFDPIYEFLLSYTAYMDKNLLKVIDLGPAWARRVSASLPAEFTELTSGLERGGFPCNVTDLCPNQDSVEAFLDWFAAMSVGDLYEHVLAAVGDPARLSPDLGAQRDRLVKILTIWYRSYYRHLDPRITEELARAAERAEQTAKGLTPEAAVEAITGGIVLEDVTHVTLTPQYHCRPLNMFETRPNRSTIGYPVEALPTAPGEIPPDLRNLARALADDSRLHILRFLAGGIRSFTDLVKLTGLAKSTVHHHMVILRHSGLVRVHFRPEGADRYSLRPEGIDRISPRLHAFLKEE